MHIATTISTASTEMSTMNVTDHAQSTAPTIPVNNSKFFNTMINKIICPVITRKELIAWGWEFGYGHSNSFFSPCCTGCGYCY